MGSAFGSRSFQALFPAYSIKFCRRLCGVFAACFNSSLLPPNSSLVFFPFFQCGKQAAQADVDGAKVGDLVNFQLGVQLAAFLQNFAGLVGEMASRPQPKDTSCTRSISGWVVQYLAAAYRRLW